MVAPQVFGTSATVAVAPRVRSMLLLDSEGKRIAVKYYTPDMTVVSKQAEFEKAVFAKTARVNARGDAEITLLDDAVVLFKTLGDLTFYVVGGLDENEVLLSTVLAAFYESVSLLLRGSVDKKTVLENLDLALLAMDEVVDRGLILETDPATVAQRASMAGAEGEGGLGIGGGIGGGLGGVGAGGLAGLAAPGGPLSEQTLSKVMASAKEQLARSLLK